MKILKLALLVMEKQHTQCTLSIIAAFALMNPSWARFFEITV